MPELPSRASSERSSTRRGIAASLLLHAVVIALLILLLQGQQVPDPPAIPIALAVLETGAAGTAGGSEAGAAEPEAASATADVQPLSSPAPETEAPVAPLIVPLTTPTPTASVAPKAAKIDAKRPPHPAHKPRPPQLAREAPEHEAPVREAPAPEAPMQIATVPPTADPSPSAGPAPAAAPGKQGLGGTVEGPGAGAGSAGAGNGIAGTVGGPGDDYLERVRRHIKRFLTYPEVAQKQKREGDATMAIVLRRDGTVLSAKVERSTGYPELDDAMLKAVHDASPVPPFPQRYTREQGEVVLPFDFHLGFFNRAFR